MEHENLEFTVYFTHLSYEAIFYVCKKDRPIDFN